MFWHVSQLREDELYLIVLVNTFKIDPLSPNSNHKPLYLDIPSTKSHSDQCIRVQNGKSYIRQTCYKKINLYANEIESHVMNLFINEDTKTNRAQSKDVILKVEYHKYCNASVDGHQMLSFPWNAWFWWRMQSSPQKCSSLQKIKIKKSSHIVSISNHGEENEAILTNARKEEYTNV